MFTPKNIQGALEELYDLCDPDYIDRQKEQEKEQEKEEKKNFR